MKRLDLVAIVSLLLAGLFWLGRNVVLQLIGKGPLPELWVDHSPLVFVGTAFLLVVTPRLTTWLIETAHLTPSPEEEAPRERYLWLFVLSFSALLLELALIRWVGAEVRFFAYFKNFVLISIFLGFGLGFALGPRKTRLFPASLVGLATLAFLVFLWGDVSLYPGISSEEQTWGHQVDTTQRALLVFMLAFFLVCLISFFVVLCGTFVALVQEMGTLFERLPRIPAYTTNLVGSLAGVVAFNLLSWAETPPVAWFAVGLLPLALLAGTPRLKGAWLVGTLVTLALVGAVDQRESGNDTQHAWSPYYRVSVGRTARPGKEAPPGLYSTSVNRKMMSMGRVVDPKLYEAYYGKKPRPSTFALPMLIKPEAKRILVLGMGMGNDVAGALDHGDPDRVVGVEIDPVMVRYAHQFHPEHPLASPKVEVVVDDARHYVESTDETFDLVILGSLDSHTLLSAYSQLRTDNFLYTRECFERIRELLSEDGILIVRYASAQPWIVDRIAATARAAFDQEPIVAGQSRVFCIVGPGLRREELTRHPMLAELLEKQERAPPPPEQTYPTDDRPFLTIHSRWLPTSYWVAIGFVIGLTLISLRQASLPITRLNPKFLLLGAGFLLAEVRLITLAGLLFGVTWKAYGIAITLVLMTLVGGTLLAGRYGERRVWPLYVLLLVAIVLSQVFASSLLQVDGLVSRLILSVVLFGPIFFLAALVFGVEFSRVESSAVPVVLASNLLGSVVGGLLEYQALAVGIASLTVTATVLYLAAGLFSWRGAK